MEHPENMKAVEIGTKERFTITVTEAMVYAFAGISADFYRVHVDEEFAKKTRFGSRIAHGALLVGFVSMVMGRLGDRIPPPGGVSYRYDVKFKAPVRFGDTITTELTVTEKNPAKREAISQVFCTNQHGEKVLEGRTVMKFI